MIKTPLNYAVIGNYVTDYFLQNEFLIFDAIAKNRS
jgi:hypothetical protein